MTSFNKSDLDLSVVDPSQSGDGFRYLLDNMDRELRTNPGQNVAVDAYLKNEPASSPLFAEIVKDAKRAKVTKDFVKQVAGYDLDPKTVSAFDLAYAIYDIYGQQWKETWQTQFAETGYIDRYRTIGASQLDPKADPALKAKSLALLQGLAVYVNALPATDPMATSATALDFYWNQKDPAVVQSYLQFPYRDFLNLDTAGKAALFAKVVKRQFPDAAITKELFKLVSFAEGVEFTKACFQSNIESSLPLFEQVSLPSFRTDADQLERKSEESLYFPNLPQGTPYASRQAAIDKFLGTPVLTRKTNIWKAAAQGARVTLKKYLWVGQTEVFSIESEKPGPTTLIFAPHFHEDNPRKQFHWLKDIPLQSGRIIVIPEANRAAALQKIETNPMNRIFDRALSDDRIDYLVVRRVEYLMGLVDGMIGDHDAHDGPYFISDMVKQNKFGNNINPEPIPSPWIPNSVKSIVNIVSKATGGVAVSAQPQWQVAESARGVLQRLTGNVLDLVPEDITGPQSHSTKTATGYMNFHLKKPGMTFEGRKGKEHGQLHAMAIYGMLLAYGHKIDPSFEKILANPNPVVDHSLYIGLPITSTIPTTATPATGTSTTTAPPSNPNNTTD